MGDCIHSISTSYSFFEALSHRVCINAYLGCGEE